MKMISPPFRVTPSKLIKFHTCCGFSLVELLTVVAVISMMAVFTSVSIFSNKRAATLTEAGNTVVDMARFAQQMALTKSEISALVFSDSEENNEIIITVLTLGVDGEWTQIIPWKKLPAIISRSETTEQLESAEAMNSMSDNELQLTQNGNQIPLSSCRGIIFLPQGQIRQSTNLTFRRLRLNLPESSDNFYDIIFRCDSGSVFAKRAEDT